MEVPDVKIHAWWIYVAEGKDNCMRVAGNILYNKNLTKDE